MKELPSHINISRLRLEVGALSDLDKPAYEILHMVFRQANANPIKADAIAHIIHEAKTMGFLEPKPRQVLRYIKLAEDLFSSDYSYNNEMIKRKVIESALEQITKARKIVEEFENHIQWKPDTTEQNPFLKIPIKVYELNLRRLADARKTLVETCQLKEGAKEVIDPSLFKGHTFNFQINLAPQEIDRVKDGGVIEIL